MHGWLNAPPDGFAPKKTLTRGEAADVLVSAFQLAVPKTELDHRWGFPAPVTRATFKDVPLYSARSVDIEILFAAHAVKACAEGADRFCPDEVETVVDFLSSLAVLTRERAAGIALHE